VVISLSQKLDAAGLRQSIKSAHYLGTVLFELLYNDPRQTEGDFKSAFESPNNIQHQPVGRKIAFVGDFTADGSVLEFVKVPRRVVKNCIMSQAKRLMNLKIKTH